MQLGQNPRWFLWAASGTWHRTGVDSSDNVTAPHRWSVAAIGITAHPCEPFSQVQNDKAGVGLAARPGSGSRWTILEQGFGTSVTQQDRLRTFEGDKVSEEPPLAASFEEDCLRRLERSSPSVNVAVFSG